jgi:hypothetical protein
MTTEDLNRLARKRANAKMGWFIHAAVFLAVNLMLWTISLASGHYWAAFPSAGWAVGLAIHGAVVFLATSDLQEKLVQRERERLAHQRDPW